MGAKPDLPRQKTFGEVEVEQNDHYQCTQSIFDCELGVIRKCKNSSYYVVRDEQGRVVDAKCRVTGHGREDLIKAADGEIDL